MPTIVGFLMSTKKRTRMIVGALVLFVFVGLFLWPSALESVSDEEEILNTVDLVAAGSLVSERVVSSTLGTVQSLQDVSVRAETSGQIINISITEGDTVAVGQVLVEIERQSLDAQVLQAQARLTSAQATLNKLINGDRPEDIQIIEQKLISEEERLKEMKNGSRPEELAVSMTNLDNAKKNRTNAETDLANTLEKAERDLEAQIQKSVDQIQSSSVTMEKILTQNLQDIIYPSRFPSNRTCELQIVTFSTFNIESQCFETLKSSEEQKKLSEQYLALENSTYDQVLTDLNETKTRLQKLRDFTATTLEVATAGIATKPFGGGTTLSLADADLVTLKNTVTSGQAEVEAKITQVTAQIDALRNQEITGQTAIDSAKSKLTQSENSVDNAKNELILKKIGSTDEQIAIQESQIKQLGLQLKIAKEGARSEDIQAQQASVQQAQADLAVATSNRDKAVIRAPISGTVLQFGFDVGDYLSNGEEVLLMANRDRLEVITFVTEDERRFIEKGSPVQILEDTVKGSVTRISPALDRQTKKIGVTITVEEGQEELVIGQTVFAGFELVMDAKSVRIPLETVKVVGNSAFVFTINEEKRVSIVPVTAGRIIGETIIVSGLDPKKLIIPNVANLEGGQEVILSKRTSADGIEQVYFSVPNKYPEMLPQLSPDEA